MLHSGLLIERAACCGEALIDAITSLNRACPSSTFMADAETLVSDRSPSCDDSLSEAVPELPQAASDSSAIIASSSSGEAAAGVDVDGGVFCPSTL